MADNFVIEPFSWSDVDADEYLAEYLGEENQIQIKIEKENFFSIEDPRDNVSPVEIAAPKIKKLANKNCPKGNYLYARSSPTTIMCPLNFYWQYVCLNLYKLSVS